MKREAELAEIIRREQEKCFNTYGYRRMCLAWNKRGIYYNPEAIPRVMRNMARFQRYAAAQSQLHSG